jgi:hypothetical protein
VPTWSPSAHRAAFEPRSSLAEFDGAIARLFRKTKGLERLPHDMPNFYTVTLFDLTTWQEVDIIVDERLARKPDGTGLLGRHVETRPLLRGNGPRHRGVIPGGPLLAARAPLAAGGPPGALRTGPAPALTEERGRRQRHGPRA